MLKKLYAVLMTLFLTAAILPQPVLAEEEPAETTEETVTEAEEVTEEVPEEVIAEEEEEPEEAVIVEEEPAEEEVTPVEEPEEEIEEPEAEIIPEEEPAEEIEPEEEIEEPVEEPEEIIVPEETEPEEEVIPEEVPAEEVVEEPAEEPEEVIVPEEEPAEEVPAEEEPVVIEEEVEEKTEIAEAASYTVTFNANGGKMFETETTYVYTVSEGGSVYIGSASYYALERAGYAFDGWYTSKDFKASQKVELYTYYSPSKNTTLYAKWAAAYKIVANANGGTFTYNDNAKTITKYVKKGSSLSDIYFDEPQKSGYKFRGWALKSTAATTETISTYSYTPTKNTTLYAVYVPEVIVKLNANGGTFSSGDTAVSLSYAKGEYFYSYSLSNIPTKSGYVFYAWYTSKSSFTEANKVSEQTKLTKNMTLYARYVKYYTVTYKAVGGGKYGTLNRSAQGSYESGLTKAALNVPQGMTIGCAEGAYVYDTPADGYTFDGYYLDSSCTLANKITNIDYYVPAKNTTIYVKWVKQVKVVFNGNGGKTIDGEKTYTCYTGSGKPVGQQPNFTNGKKTFAGWYLDKALTKKVNYPFGYAPTKNTTFYAKWESPVTITFNANGGTFSNSAKTTTYPGKKGSELRQNVEQPSRAGYVFAGWYADKDFKTYVGDPYHYSVTKAATLYAKWAAAVTITYKAGKGYMYDNTGSQVTSMKYTYAKGYTVYGAGRYYDHQLTGAGGDGGIVYSGTPYAYYADTDYDFVGWFTDSALTKPFDTSTVLTKNITLYAKYAKYSTNWITLTIDPNGGKIRNDRSNKVTIQKNVYLSEYAFEGYVAAPSGKALVGYTTTKNDPKTLLHLLDKPLTKNTTIYAYYAPQYTVVLNTNGGFVNTGSYYDGSVYNVFNTTVVKVTKGNTVGYVTYNYGSKTSDHLLTNSAGLIFRGWYSDKACTKLVTYDLYSYKPTKNITLYAKWGKPTAAGWKKTNGKWWYKLENGDYYKNGFQYIKNKYYYFNASGYILTGWQKINNSWYWFDSSGAMASGWKQISGKWYYFSGYYGGEMQTGWQKISGKWYYFLSGGAMVTGWKKLGGKWYYFESGGAMKTGWLKSGGNWYYFNASGAMVTGSVTIGSKTYNFNSSGVCLNP